MYKNKKKRLNIYKISMKKKKHGFRASNPERVYISRSRDGPWIKHGSLDFLTSGRKFQTLPHPVFVPRKSFPRRNFPGPFSAKSSASRAEQDEQKESARREKVAQKTAHAHRDEWTMAKLDYARPNCEM